MTSRRTPALAMRDAAVRRRSCPRKSGRPRRALASLRCRLPRAPASTYGGSGRSLSVRLRKQVKISTARSLSGHAVRQAVLRVRSGYRPPAVVEVNVLPPHVEHFAAALRRDEP